MVIAKSALRKLHSHFKLLLCLINAYRYINLKKTLMHSGRVVGPGMVTRFRNTSRTQTSVMLEWTPPNDPTVEIVVYNVSCFRISGINIT